MNFYKLIVAYDGTGYHGWQEQSDLPTVAGTLRSQFTAIFHHKPLLVGASRTDAGVHALGQVVRIGTERDLEPGLFLRVFQQHLPSAIHIRSLERAPQGFHPQHNVVQKTYYYHFFLKRPMPFFAGHGWFYRSSVDCDKLRDALAVFVGTHDFRSFCTGHQTIDTVRTIDSLELQYYKRYDVYRVVVKGPSFLYNMIRRIVGGALTIASDRKRSVEDLAAILAAKDPHQQLLNAPAHGLLLRKILYNPQIKDLV